MPRSCVLDRFTNSSRDQPLMIEYRGDVASNKLGNFNCKATATSYLCPPLHRGTLNPAAPGITRAPIHRTHRGRFTPDTALLETSASVQLERRPKASRHRKGTGIL